MTISKPLKAILLASALLPSFALADEIPQDAYNRAIEAYNASKFEQCYKEFNELFAIKSDDAKVNFHLGRCATEIKLYDEAQLAFERVLMVDPTHVRSRLEMGRLYFEQKQLEEALSEFEAVLESNAPEAIKAQVKQLVAAIEESKKKHFISGAFIVGLTADTNVNNDIGSRGYVPDALGTQLTGNKAVFDYSMSETLAVNHTYKINKSNWTWADAVVVYHQHYRQAVGSNVLFTSFSSGPAYKSDKYEISFTPSVESLKYGLTHISDNSDGLVGRVTGLFSKLTTIDRLTDTMAAIGFAEKFSMPLPQYKVMIDQTLSYKQQFFKTTDGMGAKVIELSANIKKPLDGGKNISVGVVVSRNMQVTAGRTDVAQSAKTLKLDYSMPVEKLFDLSLSASIKRTTYDAIDTTYGYKEQDIYKNIGATATKILNPTTILNASFNRAYQTSTFDSKVYQKNTFGVSLIKAF